MTEETKPITCEEFEARVSEYLDGALSKREGSLFNYHRDGCAQCQELTRELLLTTEALALLKEAMPKPSTEMKALSAFLDLYPEPPLPAGLKDWTPSKLLWLRFGGREGTLRIEELIKSTTEVERENLAAWMVGRAEVVFGGSIRAAERLAQEALLLAESSNRQTSKAFLALSWAALGASRAHLNPQAAALASRRARELIAGEELDSRTEARILVMEALRLSVTGEMEAAEVALRRAQQLFSDLGDRRRSLGVLINLAANSMRAGRISKAVRLFENVVSLLDHDDPPRLHVTVLTNLAVAYCESGSPERAIELVEKLDLIVDQVGADWPVHLTWLKGTVARSLGDRDGAMRYFQVVLEDRRLRGEVVSVLEVHLDILRTLALEFEVEQCLDRVNDLERDALTLGMPGRLLSSIAVLREAIVQHNDVARYLSALKQLETWIAVRVRH